MGTVLFLLLVPVNMILDPAVYWKISLWLVDFVAALGKFLFSLLAGGLIRYLRKNKHVIRLPERIWGMCALLCAAPLFVVLSFSFWYGFSPLEMEAEEFRLAYTILPFAALSAAAVLIAITVFSRQQELEQSAKLTDFRKIYYDNLRTQDREIRRFRHDICNHLTVLGGLLEKKEYESVREYIETLSDSSALKGMRRICDNETANIVFSCKLEEMSRLGLSPDILVTVPTDLGITDTDICSLLGNALDNAMEAAREAKEKDIVIRARADRGMFMFRVENSFAIPPQIEQGSCKTKKPNPQNHGFGLEIMKEIADRYGGSLETTVKNGRFELVVCLSEKMVKESSSGIRM